MNVRGYAINLIPEGIYSLITIIYLSNLHTLNGVLRSTEFETPLKLLAHNDYVAAKYFLLAFLLALAGGKLLWRRVKDIWERRLFGYEILSAFTAILILSVLLILLIVFINNPIFRAILATSVMVIGGLQILRN